MKIAFITAGAAGMYCGSCIKDNTLVAALNQLGHDSLLIPTYTPISTDEENVSQERVFFGGINVYLQQKAWIFRHTPWLMDRLLDFPRLLRWVSRFAAKTKYEDLAALTISMLQGKNGKQRKELRKLILWLNTEVKPDVILITNVLLSGLVPELKRARPVPIYATLQGDDIFLEALPIKERQYCRELIRQNCEHLTGLLATSRYYADFMANYIGMPRERIEIVYPGINLKGHGGTHSIRTAPPYTLGYFARICPEKGFHQLIDAFIHLRQMPEAPICKLRVSGWLGEGQKPFFEEQMQKVRQAGLEADVEYVPCPTHAGKVAFLQSLDLLSVPTVYQEPKGLYLLEAWANGVPVVQPNHGSFPEWIEATHAGLLVEPLQPAALAQGICELLNNPTLRQQMSEQGQKIVHEQYHARAMAERTLAVIQKPA